MKVYVVQKLEELDMNLPELETKGAYRTKEGARKALVDWIFEAAKSDPDFADALAHDENHEDLDPAAVGIPTREYVLDWVNAADSYYVFSYNNSYHFEIADLELMD